MKPKLGTRLAAHVQAYYESNDEAHLAPVFAALGPYLNSFTLSKLGVQCPGRRADMVQDSLIHILEALRSRRFQSKPADAGARTSMLAWAVMVHRNLFINSVRGKQIASKPNGAEDALAAIPVGKITQMADAEVATAAAAARRTLDAVTAAVHALPAKQRDAFLGYYYQGLGYKEVAQQMGIPEGTARVQVCVAMKSLTAWAAKKLARPTEELYEALVSVESGDLFGDGPASRRAARGYFTNASRMTKQRKKRRAWEDTALA